MSYVWVIGSGGLLGQALVREIIQTQDTTFFQPPTKLNWSNPSTAREQIKQATQQFALLVKQNSWAIYWAAGTGTMHSAEEDLQAETALLKTLVSALLHETNLNLQLGTFVFASSAGAIYAGVNEDDVITELTPPAPVNAYGKSKLEQEKLIEQLNKEGQGVNVIACRISTLYGFKAKSGKQQGLIAEMIRRTISNEVVHIYVPLETMRDYISAKDAAKQMIAFAKERVNKQGVRLHIIASAISTSVAQILAILKQISKRNIHVVTQADVKSLQYQRVMQFKPLAKQDQMHQNNKPSNLIEGILVLMSDIQKSISHKENQ